jgi:serine/threonine-protein kinase
MHLELGEKVALKFLRPEALANQELVGRFAREARACVKIKSEYVARVFDVGSLPDGAPFIVMEYLEGKDLGELLREQGQLPVKQAVEYVMQACEALAVAHVAGIVHRDVKPENLFLVQEAQGMDRIKVLDFGISKVALTGSVFETKMPLVRTMMPMGSPVYMSPEQIRASKDIDPRTDIWALGCTLYELLTGVAAFDAPSLTQITAAILESQPPSVQALSSLVPGELEAVVNRCIEKDPKNRYQNVGELAIALYPFAPRRARISAERCSYVLRTAHHVSQAEFELPSQMPPAKPGTQTGSGTAVSRDSVTMDPGGAVLSPDSGAFGARNPWKRLALVGFGVAAVAGAYALFGRHDNGSGPAAAESARAPAVAAPPALLATAVSPPVPVIDPAAAAQAATGSASAPVVRTIAPGQAPTPRVRAPVVQSRAKAPPPPAGRPAASGNHELDVGF